MIRDRALLCFFFSSRRRHTRSYGDWSSDVCSSDLVAERDDLLSVSVELVDARDDTHIWGAQYIRNPADLFTVQETIAREITDKLRLKLTSEVQKRLTRRHTESAEAYQLYLKGRYYFNKLTVD